MIVHIPGRGPLTEEESNRLFMALLADDKEDSPWMVMGSLQWAAASDFFQSLREYVKRQNLPWFVSGMTPILYRWPGLDGKRQLAPDIFVARAEDRPRSSFDLDVEHDFPPFVLEVVSPSSLNRDQGDKRLAYEMLGVREYALFYPHADHPSELRGFRRSEGGSFELWPRDDQDRLWSDVLGLYLVAQGSTIRAATLDGELLPTLHEAIEARQRETEARQRETEARQRDAEARREVEAQNARLRQEIQRLQRLVKPE